MKKLRHHFNRFLTLAAGFVIAVNHAQAGSLTFSDTWKDKVVHTHASYGGYSYTYAFLVQTGSFSTSISLPLGLDGFEADSNTVFSLTIAGVNLVSDTLGDATSYNSSKKTAVFPLMGMDAAGDSTNVGTLSLNWTTSTLTISGRAAADLLGEEAAFSSLSAGTPYTTNFSGYSEVDILFDSSTDGGQTFGYTNYYVKSTGSDTETENTNVQSALESGSITGAANLVPPKLTITSPSATYKVTDANYSTLVLSGTAIGNSPIQSLSASVNNNPDAVTVDTTEDLPTNSVHWSTDPIDLSQYGYPGTNTVTIYATDVSGNVAEVTRKFVWSESNTITVQVNPATAGKVTGLKSGEVLKVGVGYPVTATPASEDWIFAGWLNESGQLYSVSAKTVYYDEDYTYTNATAPVLTAYFVQNPFETGLAGTYTGLYFDTEDGITNASSGYITITASKTGSFSGKLISGGNGKSYGLSGQFSSSFDGTYEIAYQNIKISTDDYLYVSIQLTNSDTGGMSGYVDGFGYFSQLQGQLSVINKGVKPGLRNLYISAISGDPSTGPGGYSYGSANVGKTGTVAYSLHLADGVSPAISFSSGYGSDGSSPVFASLSGGKGLILGWAEFLTDGSGGMDQTNLTWIEDFPASGSAYTNDFYATPTFSGDFYTAPKAGTDIFGDGITSVTLSVDTNYSGLSLENGVDYALGFNPAKNTFAKGAATLKITPTTGAFTGTIPWTGTKTFTVNGTVIDGVGYGFYVNPTNKETGPIILNPPPSP